MSNPAQFNLLSIQSCYLYPRDKLLYCWKNILTHYITHWCTMVVAEEDLPKILSHVQFHAYRSFISGMPWKYNILHCMLCFHGKHESDSLLLNYLVLLLTKYNYSFFYHYFTIMVLNNNNNILAIVYVYLHVFVFHFLFLYLYLTFFY